MRRYCTATPAGYCTATPGGYCTATPAGVAPAGSATEPCAVSLPPSAANSAIAAALVSLTYSVRPSPLSRTSAPPVPAWLPTAVEPSSSSRVISTQHGAVWSLANGERPIEASVPSPATLNAETVPLPGPACAFETNSCPGFVGRNSLPNEPAPYATMGSPARRSGARRARLGIVRRRTVEPGSGRSSPLAAITRLRSLGEQLAHDRARGLSPSIGSQ